MMAHVGTRAASRSSAATGLAQPVQVGPSRTSGCVPMIAVYLVLVNLIPPQLVLPGLGAAGRPAGVFMLGLLFWWGCTRLLPSNRAPQFVAIRWAMVVYLMAVMLSMVAAIDRGLPGVESRSMDRQLLVILGFVGLVLVLIDELRSVDDVERVLWWAVVLGGVGAAVGIVQFVVGYDLTQHIRIPGLRENVDPSDIGTRGTGEFARVRGFARHPIEFGVILATLLPIGLSLSAAGTRARRSTWIATAAIGVAVPLSISRSAILGFGVGMAVYAIGWTWRQRVKAAAIGAVVMAGFQVVTPGLLGTIRALFENVGTDNSVSGRTEDYSAVGDYIAERPWLGRGPGTFLVDRYRLLDNEYLGTLIEMGLVGLVALGLVFLCSAATAMWLTRHGADERVRSHGRALGATIAIAIVTFATFDALFFPIYSGLLMLMIGCLGALYRLAKEHATMRSGDRTLPVR